MSAFLCSDRHTAVVAQLLHTHGFITADVPRTITELRRLNNAAMAHRYGDARVSLKSRAGALADAHAWLESHTLAASHLAVVECFEYQCDEGSTLAPTGFYAVALESLQRVLTVPASRQPATPIWSI